MSEDTPDMESVRRKFENLDSELNAFLETIKEIKEIRNSTGDLPEIIRRNEAEISNQKKELEELLSSARNLLIALEGQAKAILQDVEVKKGSSVLQGRPSDVDKKLKDMENRLTDMFFYNLGRQKKVILGMLGLLMATIAYFSYIIFSR